MKRLFQIAAIILFPLWGMGQSYFNRLVTKDDPFLYSKILVRESEYLVLGSGYNPTVLTYLIHELKSNGICVKSHVHGNEPLLYINGHIAKFKSGFAHVGTIRDSAINGGPTDPYLSLFNKNIENILNKRFKFIERGNETVRGVLATDSNEIVFGGYTSSSDQSFGDAYLMAIDSVGEILWKKNYGTNGLYETCVSITRTSDKGYALLGIRGQGIERDSWVVKTDSLGDIEWEKTYGDEFPQYGGGIALAPDGNLIFSNTSDSTESNKTSRIKLFKVDSETGDVIFEETYSQFNDGFVQTNPVINPDGTVVMGGVLA